MVSLTLLPKTLVLMLAICVVFTVALTENLQLADGFASKSTKGWTYELNPGESQVLTWTLINGEDKPINIEFRGEGKGSEFFIYEKLVTMEAKSKQTFEFIVTIPDDHPNNIEYRPVMFALEKAIRDPSGGSQVMINYEMAARPLIKIGDNPIYTPPAPVIVEEEPKPVAKERPSDEDFKVVPQETLQEKLDRIKATNLANQLDKPVIVTDDIWDKDSPSVGEWTGEEAVPELQVDDNYLEEPTADLITQNKVECGFIDWLLSLFGMAKC